jgi:hypothetical protein
MVSLLTIGANRAVCFIEIPEKPCRGINVFLPLLGVDII